MTTPPPAAGAAGWRRFTLFDAAPARPSPSSPPLPTTPAASAGGAGGVALADKDGSIVVVVRGGERTWRGAAARGAHGGGVAAVAWVDTPSGASVVVSVGVGDAAVPELRVWAVPEGWADVEASSSAGATAAAASSPLGLTPLGPRVRVHASSRVPSAGGTTASASTPTCLAVDGAAWPRVTAAVGGRDGRVTLITFTAGGSSSAATRVVAAPAPGGGPVTGLAFCGGGAAGNATLLAATPACVAAIDARSGGRTPVDGAGAPPHCAPAAPAGAGLAVARSEAVYLYDGDGRGPCFALGGRKVAAEWVGGCVAVVVEHGASSTSSTHPVELILFDPRRRVIAGSLTLAAPPAALARCGDGAFVLSSDGTTTLLTRRPLAARTAALAARGDHAAALALAEDEGAPPSALASLRRAAGDAALARRDADAAAAHYAAAVAAGGDAAYAVRRLLDGDRVAALASFLESVVAAAPPACGAPADHTTLLVAAYCALRDGAKLDAFLDGALKKTGEGGENGGVSLALDARSAYDVCRAAGFTAAARRIAEAASEPEWVADCIMDGATPVGEGGEGESGGGGEESAAASAAARADALLAYSAPLPRAAAAALARRHGRALLAARPEGATALFMRLAVAEGGGTAHAACA